MCLVLLTSFIFFNFNNESKKKREPHFPNQCIVRTKGYMIDDLKFWMTFMYKPNKFKHINNDFDPRIMPRFCIYEHVLYLFKTTSEASRYIHLHLHTNQSTNHSNPLCSVYEPKAASNILYNQMSDSKLLYIFAKTTIKTMSFSYAGGA